MRHKRVYHLLIEWGHSPLKALEIVQNAIRGDEYSLFWIRLVRSLTNAKT